MIMSDGKALRRADFGYGIDIPTRWADADAYGHVNNVIYYSWFDTAVTRMLYEREVLNLHGDGPIGLCVRSACDYFAPVEFPQTVHARVRLGRIGFKSLTYEVGLFLEGRDEPVAGGHFVHVFVDRQTRQPVELPSLARQRLADLAV
ncbi:MAG: acyl-CoA thioesterase [Brevundimonas sp.]|nr:MAG: acyl-CoA thioesterase [Brevundimonas sp.]